jgi:hypothetical protein
VKQDARRLLVTALLVYAAFWNPWLQSSMTWNFLDASVSFVESGRWEMAHPGFYDWTDTATARGRVVSAEPPGLPVLLVPFYVLWRTLIGPVDRPDAFQAFNGALALVLGSTAAALTATQVAWLAARLGATEAAAVWTALVFAFGTQNFVFGTMLMKENVTALAVITAVRLALGPGAIWHRVAAGAAAGAAVTLAHPAGLLTPLLLIVLFAREGAGRAAAFLLGSAPFVAALAAYNTWMFGRPWRSGYLFLTGLSGLGFVRPKLLVLLDLLVGPSGGLFLYSPFLLLALAGLVRAWRTGRRGEAALMLVLLAGIWLAAASWQSQFRDRASWAISLGPRMLFPAIPLFAAFAALGWERLHLAWRVAVAAPSVLCGYLSAQAGFIPGSNPLPYAVKTWISGTGMGVFFKEALPAWLGMDTLHTVVSRPDVSAADLLRMLSTHAGLALARNQALFLALNLLVLAGIAWTLTRIWRGAKPMRAPASAS